MSLNVNQDFSRRVKISEDRVHREVRSHSHTGHRRKAVAHTRSLPDTFEAASLTEPRGRLAARESLLRPSPTVLGLRCMGPFFTLRLNTGAWMWSQVLMLLQQALSPTEHLPSPRPAFMMVQINGINKRNQTLLNLWISVRLFFWRHVYWPQSGGL